MSFQANPDSIYFKSPKPNDPRLGDIARTIDLNGAADLEPGWVITGYPDDDGIKANFGQVGAKEAPMAIRYQLYRLAKKKLRKPIYDLGNFEPNDTLKKRHQDLKAELIHVGKKHSIISFGGGHDYGYPDVAAFLENCDEEDRPFVINIDAHLDVRQPTQDQDPHSGSPFYRLLEEYSNFQLIQFGYQAQACSLAHEEYCRDKGVILIPFEERHQVMSRLAEFFQSPRPCFLSIDIDAFSSAFAPGASASWPVGLQWADFEPLFLRAIESSDLRGVGIYEVSPPLDENHKTSKLAASMAFRLICEV